MATRERNDVEIRDDDEGSGAIVSFPFDAAIAERFRARLILANSRRGIARGALGLVKWR